MTHTKPTQNERLRKQNEEIVKAFAARIMVLETLVGALIKHFDLKIEDEPESVKERPLAPLASLGTEGEA